MAFDFLKKAVSKTTGALTSSVDKLKSGLAKTRDVFVGGLRSLLRGRKLDQRLLDELEQRLITSDLGVPAITFTDPNNINGLPVAGDWNKTGQDTTLQAPAGTRCTSTMTLLQ